ncbi:UNVERIFIED_CONTAM: hypothetical protein PYX00_004696 [Menopon gallinae]|uniref:Basement membrane-specific heparan sulfate proteoglycan core protein n=1 Tax=Menopon gallinae TaxID=328185 RepID=A0AAW2I5M1_9NEOP
MKTGEDSFICAECPCDFCDPERGCMDCGKGEYRDNPKSDGPPVCLKCPCNDNEEACMKDEYNMVLCSCKMGYSGINCENELAQRTHLGIKMTPTNVISKEAGSLVIFNCSYNSTETMTIEFERKYGNQQKDSNQKLSHIPGLFRVLTYGKHSSAEIAIDEDLVSVDCVLRDSQSTERARTSALIMGTVTNLVIPQIKNCYNEPKYVNVNEDLELICEASGSPVPDAKWYIIENENYKYVDTVEGVHVVTKAQLDQNGTIYMCIARNSIGDDKCSTHIIVKERCLMTVSPPYLEVEEGEDVQFDCATVNRKSVMWKKQGGFLSYRANDSNGELTIKNVSISDAGQYECSLVDPSEPVTKTATLVVHLKKIPPTAVIKQGDSTLRPGDTLRINCIVSGQPKPNVTWSKIGEIFLPTNVEVDERDHSITIKDANKINNGIYECTAESAIGKSTSRIHLKVSALPRIRIEPKSVTANVGEMVVVNCLVVEGESVNTTWSRISDSPFEKNIATGKELRFQSISSSDAGKFECKATNPYGHAVEVVEVMVRQLPSVKINPDGPLSAFVGEIHDFYCNVTGSPTPRISWTLSGKQGTKPLPGTGNSVRVVVTEDMGKVTCLAENEAGTGTKSVDIIIKDEGKGSSAKYKRAPIGSRVEMIFDELNDPFNCTRSQSSLIGDECYIKNGLEIQSVQVQHNGTYICKTASGQEMSYFLQVVGFVNKFSRLNGSYIILPITLKSTKTLSVEVTFKTESTRGLILMKRKHCDFVMYLLNGRLVVKLNQIDSTNGRRKVSKVIHLKSTKLLKINVWYTVVLELRDSVELYIHDEHGTIVDSQYMTLIPNMTWTTNNEGDFFIGGGTGEKRLPLPPKDAYFDGCISRLIVDGHEYKITEEAKYSRNVTLCNVCSDNIDPCGDEGVCLDAPTQYGYICVCGKNANYCPESCMGIGCRSSHDMCSLLKPCHQQESKCVSLTSSLQCQCPAGFEGHTCETELLYEFSFDGNGYAKLPHRYLPRHSIKNPEVITIEFTQGSDTGLLLFQGDRNNFLLMFVDNDDFTYVYKNQEVVLELTADIKTMSKNSVTIRRMNNTVEISVGDSLFEEKKSEFRTNRVHGDIFIGGISPTTDFPIKYNSEGFKGCIHSLVFGSDDERVNIMANDITRHKLGKTCEAQVARRYDTYEDDD